MALQTIVLPRISSSSSSAAAPAATVAAAEQQQQQYSNSSINPATYKEGQQQQQKLQQIQWALYCIVYNVYIVHFKIKIVVLNKGQCPKKYF